MEILNEQIICVKPEDRARLEIGFSRIHLVVEGCPQSYKIVVPAELLMKAVKDAVSSFCYSSDDSMTALLKEIRDIADNRLAKCGESKNVVTPLFAAE